MVEAARSLVCLHATDPATIYLSAWARVDGMTVADLDRALYADRSLVKHLAMRRTLFVFPRETPPGRAGRGERPGRRRRAAPARPRRREGRAARRRRGAGWRARGEQVLAALADGREATSSELRDEIPLLEGSIAYGEGKSWGGQVPVGPRVLTTLSAAGRARPGLERRRLDHLAAAVDHDGGLARRASSRRRRRPRACAGSSSRGCARSAPARPPTSSGGSGSTVAAVRRALAELGAVEVDLDGATGYLLPDDLEPPEPVEPWAALLPPLDPTTMGWAERDWYLGAHKALLFDTQRQRAAPTAWWDGRIVGGWRQDERGRRRPPAARGRRRRRGARRSSTRRPA